MVCLFSNKFCGESNSTICPLSKTTTRSESMIVFNLCAIVRTVQSLNSVRIVLCIKSSVSKSTAAVASSRMRTLVFLNRALLKQISCLWPTDKFSPPSDTSWFKPAGKPAIRLNYKTILLTKLNDKHKQNMRKINITPNKSDIRNKVYMQSNFSEID